MRFTHLAALILSSLTLSSAIQFAELLRLTTSSTPPDSDSPLGRWVLDGELIEPLELRQAPGVPPVAPYPAVPNADPAAAPAAQPVPAVAPAVPAVGMPGVQPAPAVPGVPPAGVPAAVPGAQPGVPPGGVPAAQPAPAAPAGPVPGVPAGVPGVQPAVLPAGVPAGVPAAPPAVPAAPPAGNPLTTSPTASITVQWMETWFGTTSRTWVPKTITFHDQPLTDAAPLPGKGQIGMGTLTGRLGVTKTVIIKGAAKTVGPEWKVGAVAAVGVGVGIAGLV